MHPQVLTDPLQITIADNEIVVLTVESALRKIVPTFYILAAVYLSASSYVEMQDDGEEEVDEGPLMELLEAVHNTTFVRLPYVLLFGSTGAVTYLILNEPQWVWLPYGSTDDIWLMAILILILAMGVLLFNAVVERQRLKRPGQYVNSLVNRILNLF